MEVLEETTYSIHLRRRLKQTGIISEEDITINVVSSFFIYQHLKYKKDYVILQI